MKVTTLKINGSGSGVYLLKLKGVVVYVGMSSFVVGRMAGHVKKAFDEIEIIWMPKKAAAKLEKVLITKYRPKLNKVLVFGKSGEKPYYLILCKPVKRVLLAAFDKFGTGRSFADFANEAMIHGAKTFGK